MAKKAAAKKLAKRATAKPSVKNRTVGGDKRGPGVPGAPFAEQDVKRRLGNFTGKGEAPRKGGRTSGIVGQTKSQSRTDKKSK